MWVDPFSFLYSSSRGCRAFLARLCAVKLISRPLNSTPPSRLVLLPTGQRRLAESKENAHCLQSDKNSLLAERDQLLRERDEALSKLYAAETTLKSKETEIRALASKLESTQKRLLLLEDANAALKGANEKLVGRAFGLFLSGVPLAGRLSAFSGSASV